MYVGRIDKLLKYMELECRFLSLLYIELTCSVVSVYQSVCSKGVSACDYYPWSVTSQMEPTPSSTFYPVPLLTWGFLWPWPCPIRHVQLVQLERHHTGTSPWPAGKQVVGIQWKCFLVYYFITWFIPFNSITWILKSILKMSQTKSNHNNTN